MGQDIRDVPRLLSGQAHHVRLGVPEKFIQSSILARNYPGDGGGSVRCSARIEHTCFLFCFVRNI